MRQRSIGTGLLLLSAITGVVMSLCDWFIIPYETTAGTAGFAKLKLIDALAGTALTPPDAAEPMPISPFYLGEAAFYLLGVVGCLLLVALVLRNTRFGSGVFWAAFSYLVILGLYLAFRQMGMGLYALSAPYIGIKATSYQWLLLIFGGGIFMGTGLLVARDTP